MKRRIVSDIMQFGVITCPQDEKLGEVAAILSDAEISALVIVNDEGKALGVISQYDLLDAFKNGMTPQDLRSKTAQSILPNRRVVTTMPDDPIEDAAQKMVEEHVHRLFILDSDEKPIAVVSVTDIVRDLRNIYYKKWEDNDGN